MQQEPPVFLTTSIVARLLGVAEGTVRHMERSGVLPAIRAGHVRLFERERVEQLARDRAAARPLNGEAA